MIRIIRLLGAALGAFIGLGLATASGLFQETGTSYGLILAGWTVAWLIVGFAILPYLTIVPATWIVRSVQALSTAEFVTAVGGLLIGLLMGLLLGAPLSNFPDPLGTLAAPGNLDRLRPRDGRADRGQAPGPDRGGRGDRDLPPPGYEHGDGRAARVTRTSSSTPARSSTAGSPRSSSRASSTARW